MANPASSNNSNIFCRPKTVAGDKPWIQSLDECVDVALLRWTRAPDLVGNDSVCQPQSQFKAKNHLNHQALNAVNIAGGFAQSLGFLGTLWR